MQHDTTSNGRLNDKEHAKTLIKTYKKEITTLRMMKEEEAEQGMSNGRRKWFNHRVDELKEKIGEQEQRLEELKGDSE